MELQQPNRSTSFWNISRDTWTTNDGDLSHLACPSKWWASLCWCGTYEHLSNCCLISSTDPFLTIVLHVTLITLMCEKLGWVWELHVGKLPYTVYACFGLLFLHLSIFFHDALKACCWWWWDQYTSFSLPFSSFLLLGLFFNCATKIIQDPQEQSRYI